MTRYENQERAEHLKKLKKLPINDTRLVIKLFVLLIYKRCKRNAFKKLKSLGETLTFHYQEQQIIMYYDVTFLRVEAL